MSALEQEILEKVRSLNEAQQQQVLHYIQEIQPKPFDFDQWRKEVEAFRAELAAKYGKDHVFGTLDLLAELREEESWPRL